MGKLKDNKGVKAMGNLGDDFKKFAFKGNIIDMAVGLVVGSAFTAIVTSLVKDIITPCISLLTGNVDFNNLFKILDDSKVVDKEALKIVNTVEDAQALGAVTLNYGAFINAIISFFLIAISVFVVVMLIKNANVKARKAEKAAAEAAAAAEAEKAAAEAALKKVCPFCQTEIHVNATRCPNCTSELDK